MNKLLKVKRERLQHLEALNLLHETAREIETLRKEINELLTKEEVMWNQRSRALWMKCGDRNTGFFHATASQRKRYNRIDGLWGDDGLWHEDKDGVEEIIADYFKNIFRSDQPSDYDGREVVMDIRITTDMNTMLLEKFRVEEIRDALNQMNMLS